MSQNLEKEKESQEDLLTQFSAVAALIEKGASSDEKKNKTAIFVSSLRVFEASYGKKKLAALLQEIGLNDYETEKVITLKDDTKLVDISSAFLSKVDFDLAFYKSPLSQNQDWLKGSEVDEDKLSKHFGKLVKWVATYHKNKKAEFLGILDRYIDSIYSDPSKAEIRSILESFDGSHLSIYSLYKELDKFTHRYSIQDDGSMLYVNEKAFSFNYDHKTGITTLSMEGGKTRQTDAVFDYKDGVGLLCVTSMDSTEEQHQAYKFTKALSEYSGKEKKVYPFFYCDAPFTANEEKTGKRGRPRKSTDGQISSLPKEKIQMMNIVCAMQVFLQTDIEDQDHFKYVLETSQIQIINDDGGVWFNKGTAKEKIQLLEVAVLSSLEVINQNKEFWLTPDKIAKDFKKKFILNLCNAYAWLAENELLTDPKVTEQVREALSQYTLNSVANISPREKLLITQAKKLAGLPTAKITF